MNSKRSLYENTIKHSWLFSLRPGWTENLNRSEFKTACQIKCFFFFSYWTVIRGSSKMASWLTWEYSKDQNLHVFSATWWNQMSVSLALCLRNAAALFPISFWFLFWFVIFLPIIKDTFIRYLLLWRQNIIKLCQRK